MILVVMLVVIKLMEPVFLWIHVYSKTDYIGQREIFIGVSVS